MNALLINTRPNAYYQSCQGVDVVALPLLKLIPTALSMQDCDAMRCLVSGSYDVLVVVSVEAVRGAIDWLVSQGITRADDFVKMPTVVAVGSTTKKALEAFGFSVQTPDIMSNEGMLLMSAIKSLTSEHKVMIWQGEGGRKLLAQTLISQGVSVTQIPFYKRIRTDINQSFCELLSRQDPNGAIFVIISSKAILLHWLDLIQRYDKTAYFSSAVYLVLGQRLLTLVRQKFEYYVLLNDLSQETIYQAIRMA